MNLTEKEVGILLTCLRSRYEHNVETFDCGVRKEGDWDLFEENELDILVEKLSPGHAEYMRDEKIRAAKSEEEIERNRPEKEREALKEEARRLERVKAQKEAVKNNILWNLGAGSISTFGKFQKILTSIEGDVYHFDRGLLCGGRSLQIDVLADLVIAGKINLEVKK